MPIEQIEVVPYGADHLSDVESDASILAKWNLQPKEYFLMVASQSPHKNAELLIEAIKMQKMDIQFVFVGRQFKKVFTSGLEKELPDNCRVLDYVSDNELKALYQNARGLIFPSIYEGFGFPALEAMANGCPVICSKAASLPEVCGDAALYFDPKDVQDLMNILSYSLRSGLRTRLIRCFDFFISSRAISILR